MGNLASIESAGLMDRLDMALVEFSAASMTEEFLEDLKNTIDKNGLKNPHTTRKVASFQKSGYLNNGLYPVLVQLDKELSSGVVTENTVAVSAENTASVADETDGLSSEEIAAYQFTEEQEAKIKERLKAAEDRLRSKLVEKEKAIREQLITGKAIRTVRLGLVGEDLEKYKAARDQMESGRDLVKKGREMVKSAKAIMDLIKPKAKRAGGDKRRVSTPEAMTLRIAKRKLTLAEKKGLPDIAQYRANLNAAQAAYDASVKTNPA